MLIPSDMRLRLTGACAKCNTLTERTSEKVLTLCLLQVLYTCHSEVHDNRQMMAEPL